MKNFLLLSMIALMLGSCVSQRKYDELLSKNKSLETRVDRLEQVRNAYDQLVEEHRALEGERDRLEKDRSDLQQRATSLRSNLDALNEEYDKLMRQNEVLLASATEERQALVEELGKKENEIAQKERSLERLQRDLDEKEKDLNNLQASLEEREARINELNDQINAQRDILDNVMAGIKQALMGFSDSDLTVTQKDGRVYISLSQQLLFAVGSDVIDAKGRDAITKLAEVLNANPDIDITVEGHTDSDGSADRNWDLSVSRATSVVKILTRAGVDPERITASGRAFYDPVAPNDSPANKALNRRTEVILSPDLTKLFELVQRD
jgi:chemotaxis protein MotB